jgi:protein-S-isoprenylcysteine O-methyltransferase Ste14
VFVPLSRIFTVVMAGVVCFGLIVPLAIMRHDFALERLIVGIYVVYLIANVAVWLWQRRRA